jgi:hypothetical protein
MPFQETEAVAERAEAIEAETGAEAKEVSTIRGIGKK